MAKTIHILNIDKTLLNFKIIQIYVIGIVVSLEFSFITDA